MTVQLSDYIYYNDKEYSLLYKKNQNLVFDPCDYGFDPNCNLSDCYKGHICTYEIHDNKLFLDKLEINNKFPLKFNKKSPSKIKFLNYSKKGRLKGFKYIYKNLKFYVNYTGEILIGRFPCFYDFDYNYYNENHLESPHSFQKVYKLFFRRGKLVKIVDVSNKLEHLRKVLRMEYLHKNELNTDKMDFSYKEDEVYRRPKPLYEERYYTAEDYYKR